MQQLIIADIRSRNAGGNLEGHYFSVASNYQYMYEGKFDVKVAGGPIYYNRYTKMVRLKYDTLENGSHLGNKIKMLLNGFRVLKADEGAKIVFQFSGVFTAYICLALHPNKHNVYMIQYDASSINSRLKKIVYSLIKNKVKGIICPVDEIGRKFGIPYCTVPDYIYCHLNRAANCDMSQGLSTQQFDLGIYGMLAVGKGIWEAACFFAGTEYSLMIAGKTSSDPEDSKMVERLVELAQNYPNVHLDLRYLSDETYNAYIRSTKYIVLNYSETYALRSSGVIWDSLFNERPVIAKNRRFVEFVKEEQLGKAYDNLSELNLEELMRGPVYNSYLDNIKNYLRKHDHYANKLYDFLCM